MKDIIIIGAGGIGRETAWIIEEINEVSPQWNIIGFVDDDNSLWGKTLNSYKVLGGLQIMNSLQNDVYIVVAIANPMLKDSIVKYLNGKFKFATIIYPTVKKSKYVIIGEGTIIYPGVLLTVNTNLGNHVMIGGNCCIGHDTTIEDFSTILCGSNMSGYNNVGKGAFLGVGVSLVQKEEVSSWEKINSQPIIIDSVRK